MGRAIDLLKLIQTTRSQPQYGYVLSGIRKADLSDLAQHHYLVAFTGWYLARLIRQNGGKINLEKVLEICLLHDLGELFGGDISMPYAKANPKAYRLAKKFETENQAFMSTLLNDVGDVRSLFREAMEIESDEAVVAKVADYMEVTHYKHYLGRLTTGDIIMVMQKMEKMVGQVKSAVTRKYLQNFLLEWAEVLRQDDGKESFEFAKAI